MPLVSTAGSDVVRALASRKSRRRASGAVFVFIYCCGPEMHGSNNPLSGRDHRVPFAQPSATVCRQTGPFYAKRAAIIQLFALEQSPSGRVSSCLFHSILRNFIYAHRTPDCRRRDENNEEIWGKSGAKRATYFIMAARVK